MEGAQWYYASGHEQLGPVSMEHLQGLAASGQLDQTTLVWRDGMADWQPAGQVPGLLQGERVVARRPTRAGAAPPRRSRVTAVDRRYDQMDWDQLGKPQGTPGSVIGAVIVDFLGGGFMGLIGLGVWEVCRDLADRGMDQFIIDQFWLRGLLYVIFGVTFWAAAVLLCVRWHAARMCQFMVCGLYLLLVFWDLIASAQVDGEGDSYKAVIILVLFSVAVLPVIFLLPRRAKDWCAARSAARNRGPYARRTKVDRRRNIGR